MTELFPGAEHRGGIQDLVEEFAGYYANVLATGNSVTRSFNDRSVPGDHDQHQHFGSPEDPRDPAYLVGFAGEARYAFLEVSLEDHKQLADEMRLLTNNIMTSGSLKIALGFIDERAVRPDRNDEAPIRTAAAVLLVPVMSWSFSKDDREESMGYETFVISLQQGGEGLPWTFENSLAEMSETGDQRHHDAPLWREQIEHAFGVELAPAGVEGWASKWLPIIGLFNKALGVAQSDRGATERAEEHMQDHDDGLRPLERSATQIEMFHFVESTLRQATQ